MQNHTPPSTTDIGNQFERHAKNMLLANGLNLVATQFKMRGGELDLVMTTQVHQQAYLIFIEVRARKNGNYGTALESITPQKMRKVIRTSRYFLAQYPQYATHAVRFDVVAFDCGKMTWQQDAFRLEDLDD